MGLLQFIPFPAQTIVLLVPSNVFMTFAWQGHLKNLATARGTQRPLSVGE